MKDMPKLTGSSLTYYLFYLTNTKLNKFFFCIFGFSKIFCIVNRSCTLQLSQNEDLKNKSIHIGSTAGSVIKFQRQT